MKDFMIPHTERVETFDINLDWWWRAKMGGLLLSDRTLNTDICPSCREDKKENLEHFLWECKGVAVHSLHVLEFLPTWAKQTIPADLYIRSVWLLDNERSIWERKTIDRVILEKWKLRMEILRNV